MNPITFFAPGIPKGQPRVKAFARKMGDHHVARVYTPGTAEEWKSRVAIAGRPFAPLEPITGPVRADLVLYFPRPKSHYRTGKRAGELRDDIPNYHTAKPDRDNSDKAVLDALTVLRFWHDDAQVCDGRIVKLYVDGRGPGAQITISKL